MDGVIPGQGVLLGTGLRSSPRRNLSGPTQEANEDQPDGYMFPLVRVLHYEAGLRSSFDEISRAPLKRLTRTDRFINNADIVSVRPPVSKFNDPLKTTTTPQPEKLIPK